MVFRVVIARYEPALRRRRPWACAEAFHLGAGEISIASPRAVVVGTAWEGRRP